MEDCVHWHVVLRRYCGHLLRWALDCMAGCQWQKGRLKSKWKKLDEKGRLVLVRKMRFATQGGFLLLIRLPVF